MPITGITVVSFQNRKVVNAIPALMIQCKPSLTTGRMCSVIVQFLRVLSIVSAVTDFGARKLVIINEIIITFMWRV